MFFIENTSHRTEVVYGHEETEVEDVNELLISEVQIHPILWNRQHKDYKRADKKKVVWNDIATRLRMPGMKFFKVTHFFIIRNLVLELLKN